MTQGPRQTDEPTRGHGSSGGQGLAASFVLIFSVLTLTGLGACEGIVSDTQLPGTGDGAEHAVSGDGGVSTGDQGPVTVPPGGTELQLAITAPARGATLDGPAAITVEGKVTGAVHDLTVNGAPVTATADGSFTHTVQAKHGMNLLIVEGVDEAGVTQKLVQSFYHSGKWLKPDPANPAGALLDNAVVGWLGQPVFDNGDPNKIDFAAVVEQFLAGVDIASMVPSSQRIDNVAGCDYADIKISNVQVNPANVELDVNADGLVVKVTFTALQASVKADLSGKWYNPACLIGVSGKVKASSVVVTAKLDAWVEGSQLKAKAKQTTAQVNGFNIDISGIWGFLTNWLVNKFEDDLEKDLEQQITGELDKQIGPMLAKGIGDLAISERIESAPLIGSGAPVAVDLVSRLRGLTLVEGGIRYALGATAVNKAPVGVQDSLGSIGYAGCPGADKALAFTERAKHPLQLAISDDLVNQLLYSFHQGGLLKAELTPETFGSELSGIGITDLQGSLDALLPPILNSCAEGGKPVLQLGDLRTTLKFNMIGMPVQMQVHASLEVPVELKLKQANNGQQRLHLSFGQAARIEVESKDLSDGTGTVYDTVKALIESQLGPKLLDTLAGQAISIPIPEIDLGAMDPSIPAGTKIRLKLARVEQRDGYAVVVGSIE